MIADKVIKILSEKNMHAKKMYGQNFLLDKNVLKKIVEVSSITKDDIVIEIGPGIGCLTEYLCLNSKRVICYEIDKDMVDILNENLLKNYNNLEIINCDFLKADLSSFNNLDNVKVVANLPYYITTPIIFKLLSETNIKQFTFMVQKEVGQRLTGKPNTKDYNALSVAMSFKTDSKIAFSVKPNSFYPAPNVDSVVIVIKTKKSDYEQNFEAKFLKFVQDLFAQRRKTIINNLNGKYGLDKEKITNTLLENNISINVRAESLDVNEIVNLYKLLIR